MSEPEAPVPPELACPECNKLIKNATQLPCCLKSLCRPCIYKKLMLTRRRCWFGSSPACSELVKLDLLSPSHEMRELVEDYLAGGTKYKDSNDDNQDSGESDKSPESEGSTIQRLPREEDTAKGDLNSDLTTASAETPHQQPQVQLNEDQDKSVAKLEDVDDLSKSASAPVNIHKDQTETSLVKSEDTASIKSTVLSSENAGKSIEQKDAPSASKSADVAEVMEVEDYVPEYLDNIQMLPHKPMMTVKQEVVMAGEEEYSEFDPSCGADGDGKFVGQVKQEPTNVLTEALKPFPIDGNINNTVNLVDDGEYSEMGPNSQLPVKQEPGPGDPRPKTEPGLLSNDDEKGPLIGRLIWNQDNDHEGFIECNIRGNARHVNVMRHEVKCGAETGDLVEFTIEDDLARGQVAKRVKLVEKCAPGTKVENLKRNIDISTHDEPGLKKVKTEEDGLVIDVAKMAEMTSANYQDIVADDQELEAANVMVKSEMLPMGAAGLFLPANAAVCTCENKAIERCFACPIYFLRSMESHAVLGGEAVTFVARIETVDGSPVDPDLSCVRHLDCPFLLPPGNPEFQLMSTLGIDAIVKKASSVFQNGFVFVSLINQWEYDVNISAGDFVGICQKHKAEAEELSNHLVLEPANKQDATNLPVIVNKNDFSKDEHRQLCGFGEIGNSETNYKYCLVRVRLKPEFARKFSLVKSDMTVQVRRNVWLELKPKKRDLHFSKLIPKDGVIGYADSLITADHVQAITDPNHHDANSPTSDNNSSRRSKNSSSSSSFLQEEMEFDKRRSSHHHSSSSTSSSSTSKEKSSSGKSSSTSSSSSKSDKSSKKSRHSSSTKSSSTKDSSVSKRPTEAEAAHPLASTESSSSRVDPYSEMMMKINMDIISTSEITEEEVRKQQEYQSLLSRSFRGVIAGSGVVVLPPNAVQELNLFLVNGEEEDDFNVKNLLKTKVDVTNNEEFKYYNNCYHIEPQVCVVKSSICRVSKSVRPSIRVRVRNPRQEQVQLVQDSPIALVKITVAAKKEGGAPAPSSSPATNNQQGTVDLSNNSRQNVIITDKPAVAASGAVGAAGVGNRQPVHLEATPPSGSNTKTVAVFNAEKSFERLMKKCSRQWEKIVSEGVFEKTLQVENKFPYFSKAGQRPRIPFGIKDGKDLIMRVGLNQDSRPVKVLDKVSGVLCCTICDVVILDKYTLQDHMYSLKHRKNMKLVQVIAGLEERIYMNRPVIHEMLDQFTAAPLLGLDYLFEVLKDGVHQASAHQPPTYHCALCNVNTSTIGVIQHFISTHHNLKFLKEFFPRAWSRYRYKSDLSSWAESDFTAYEAILAKIEALHDRKKPSIVEDESRLEDLVDKIPINQYSSRRAELEAFLQGLPTNDGGAASGGSSALNTSGGGGNAGGGVDLLAKITAKSVSRSAINVEPVELPPRVAKSVLCKILVPVQNLVPDSKFVFVSNNQAAAAGSGAGGDVTAGFSRVHIVDQNPYIQITLVNARSPETVFVPKNTEVATVKWKK